jgi:hypothetical protein
VKTNGRVASASGIVKERLKAVSGVVVRSGAVLSAPVPVAVFCAPVVFKRSALKPSAVLLLPVVL